MSDTHKANVSELKHRHSKSSESSDAEYKEITPGRPIRSSLHYIASITFVAAVIHYLLWWPAICMFAVALYYLLGGGWVVGCCIAAPFVLYIPSYLDGSHKRTGRPWDWLRLLPIWGLAHDYANIRLIRTAVLDPAKKYVMGWHPHGIIVLSRLAMYGGAFEQLFPGVDVRALGATPMFLWPGAREISLWLGAIDASRNVADRALKAGKSLIVYPGGSKEIFLTDANSKTTVLELRKSTGFVAMAMRNGASLVPVVVYNERDAYTRVEVPKWLQKFCLKTLRIPAVLFYGRFFSLIPRQTQLGIVFGKPIEVPHLPNADKSDPEVKKYHDIYTTALKELWEEHKAKFGYGKDEVLEIQ